MLSNSISLSRLRYYEETLRDCAQTERDEETRTELRKFAETCRKMAAEIELPRSGSEVVYL